MDRATRAAVTIGWAIGSGAALYAVGVGVSDQFQIEPTTEALAQQAQGLDLIGIGALVLLAAAVGCRVLCGHTWLAVLVGLPALLWPWAAGDQETMFPILAGLVLVPLSGLAVLTTTGLVLRRLARRPAVSPW